jgi:hypothetical protein
MYAAFAAVGAVNIVIGHYIYKIIRDPDNWNEKKQALPKPQIPKKIRNVDPKLFKDNFETKIDEQVVQTTKTEDQTPAEGSESVDSDREDKKENKENKGKRAEGQKSAKQMKTEDEWVVVKDKKKKVVREQDPAKENKKKPYKPAPEDIHQPIYRPVPKVDDYVPPPITDEWVTVQGNPKLSRKEFKEKKAKRE